MWLKQVAIAIDQLGNALIGGYADETISARCYREQFTSKRWAIMRVFVDTLLFFDKNHCYEAHLSEMKMKQLPPEYAFDNHLKD